LDPIHYQEVMELLKGEQPPALASQGLLADIKKQTGNTLVDLWKSWLDWAKKEHRFNDQDLNALQHEIYAEWVVWQPRSTYIWFRLAYTAHALGREDEALRACEVAQSRCGPGEVLIPLLRGDILELARDTSGAWGAFKEAVKISPRNEPSLHRLARLALRLGEAPHLKHAVDALVTAGPVDKGAYAKIYWEDRLKLSMALKLDDDEIASCRAELKGRE
jgi:hypothetical protein